MFLVFGFGPQAQVLLNKLVPTGVGYRNEHIDNKCGFPSQNSAVRSKRNPAYSRRKVGLGTWQRIFLLKWMSQEAEQ